jgi:hypothetical protein
MLLEENIPGPGGSVVPVIQVLFRHYFVGQFTRHHFTYVVALLPRFEHGLSRSVMLGDDGRCFGIGLIHCRPVGIHQPRAISQSCGLSVVTLVQTL